MDLVRKFGTHDLRRGARARVGAPGARCAAARCRSGRRSTMKVTRAATRITMLPREFFQRDPLTCARELIGTELVWGDCSGIVVEAEAYAAIDDEAALTISTNSALDRGNSRKRSASPIGTMKWIYARIRAIALCRTRRQLSTLWRTNASVSVALRICGGDSPCAGARS